MLQTRAFVRRRTCACIHHIDTHTFNWCTICDLELYKCFLFTLDLVVYLEASYTFLRNRMQNLPQYVITKSPKYRDEGWILLCIYVNFLPCQVYHSYDTALNSLELFGTTDEELLEKMKVHTASASTSLEFFVKLGIRPEEICENIY